MKKLIMVTVLVQSMAVSGAFAKTLVGAASAGSQTNANGNIQCAVVDPQTGAVGELQNAYLRTNRVCNVELAHLTPGSSVRLEGNLMMTISPITRDDGAGQKGPTAFKAHMQSVDGQIPKWIPTVIRNPLISGIDAPDGSHLYCSIDLQAVLGSRNLDAGCAQVKPVIQKK